MTEQNRILSGTTITFGANAFMTFHLCQVLVQKGVLTPAEAGSAMTKAAETIRQMTEDGPSATPGEGIAQKLDELAAWLLGLKPMI